MVEGQSTTAARRAAIGRRERRSRTPTAAPRSPEWTGTSLSFRLRSQGPMLLRSTLLLMALTVGPVVASTPEADSRCSTLLEFPLLAEPEFRDHDQFLRRNRRWLCQEGGRLTGGMLEFQTKLWMETMGSLGFELARSDDSQTYADVLCSDSELVILNRSNEDVFRDLSQRYVSAVAECVRQPGLSVRADTHTDSADLTLRFEAAEAEKVEVRFRVRGADPEGSFTRTIRPPEASFVLLRRKGRSAITIEILSSSVPARPRRIEAPPLPEPSCVKVVTRRLRLFQPPYLDTPGYRQFVFPGCPAFELRAGDVVSAAMYGRVTADGDAIAGGRLCLSPEFRSSRCQGRATRIILRKTPQFIRLIAAARVSESGVVVAYAQLEDWLLGRLGVPAPESFLEPGSFLTISRAPSRQ